MSEFKGKTIVITGGNSGMGFSTAKRFAQEGANVVITGRNPETLKIAESELGPNTLALQIDVTKLSEIDRLVSETTARFGKVDVLFANAGLGELRSVSQTSEEIYDKIMNTNVKGLFFTVQKFLPHLNKEASVILNSSIAGGKGMENLSVYNASKAAVRSFARSFTNDLKGQGIRVNSLSPGPIDTPFFSKTDLSQEHIEQFAQSITAQVPLGRFGNSEEIANTVYWLASRQSSYVTGIDLPVDGGIAQV